MVNKYLPLRRKGERVLVIFHMWLPSPLFLFGDSVDCAAKALSFQALSLEFLSALSSTISSHLCVSLEEILFKMCVPIDAKIRQCEKQQGVLWEQGSETHSGRQHLLDMFFPHQLYTLLNIQVSPGGKRAKKINFIGNFGITFNWPFKMTLRVWQWKLYPVYYTHKNETTI